MRTTRDLDDDEYQSLTIEKVETSGGVIPSRYWVLDFEEGSSYCGCQVVEGIEPKPGMTVRLYGKGLGYAIRGCAFVSPGMHFGLVAFYKTPEEHEEEQRIERARLKAKMDQEHAAYSKTGRHLAAPQMKIKPGMEERYRAWKAKNDDPYGGATFEFAEQWARRLEELMADGKKLADVADKACSEVDKRPGFGITGFMHGMACSILAQCWVHGEAFGAWREAEEKKR